MLQLRMVLIRLLEYLKSSGFSGNGYALDISSSESIEKLAGVLARKQSNS